MEVKNLINHLEFLKEEQSSLYESIHNLDLVLEGLNELDEMIEMQDVNIKVKYMRAKS